LKACKTVHVMTCDHVSNYTSQTIDIPFSHLPYRLHPLLDIARLLIYPGPSSSFNALEGPNMQKSISYFKASTRKGSGDGLAATCTPCAEVENAGKAESTRGWLGRKQRSLRERRS
jgi:hypothetical protein